MDVSDFLCEVMGVDEKYLRLLEASEDEIIEFKAAVNNFGKNLMGQYFSALSNEARMAGKKEGCLILGVNDPKAYRGKSDFIVGTQFKSDIESMNKLKQQVASEINNYLTFNEVKEILIEGKRILFFMIPASLPNVPTLYQGKAYGRTGESIGILSPLEIKQIVNHVESDWSKEIIPEATISDLDQTAILKAREEFKDKNPRLKDVVDEWPDEQFLNKAKITINGKITRTAILLLGKDESEHYLSPAVGRMTWILRDRDEVSESYEHFGPPFLLNVELLFSHVRNNKYSFMLNNTLFPLNMDKYDTKVIREALHNCIAHQDYEMQGKIVVVERPTELIFSNMGSFLPKTVEEVIRRDAPFAIYRNKFLAEAMVNLNMIDTIGSGIKSMFQKQRKRYFPLPEYDLSKQSEVIVKIFGKIIDQNYSTLLLNQLDLSLETVILLDKVQKQQPITLEEAKTLRKQKLIEGRFPNIYVAAEVAALADDKSTYIRNRAFDKEHYKALVISFIEQFGFATRKDINNLLLDKLSDHLDDMKKRKQIDNLLQEMKVKKQIKKEVGSNKWIMY